jgi:hypothetical protein
MVTMANRIVVIDAGRVRAVGTHAELLGTDRCTPSWPPPSSWLRRLITAKASTLLARRPGRRSAAQ